MRMPEVARVLDGPGCSSLATEPGDEAEVRRRLRPGLARVQRQERLDEQVLSARSGRGRQVPVHHRGVDCVQVEPFEFPLRIEFVAAWS